MYKNPPQQQWVLSLQGDCHHCLGPTRVWSPSQESSLGLSITLNLGSKHGASQRCYEPFLMLLNSKNTKQMVREDGPRATS